MPTIRDTRQRRAIRETFERAGRPLGPDEALRLAQEQLPSLSIATVYRNVKALLDEEWLVPVAVPGQSSRYEVAGKEHHHHFHCRACGKMFELKGCVPNLRSLLPRGFRISDHDLLLYGTCVQCVEAHR